MGFALMAKEGYEVAAEGCYSGRKERKREMDSKERVKIGIQNSMCLLVGSLRGQVFTPWREEVVVGGRVMDWKGNAQLNPRFVILWFFLFFSSFRLRRYILYG